MNDKGEMIAAAGAWQPIESAPKDGQEVLLFWSVGRYSHTRPLRPDEVEVLMWPEKRGGMKVGMESGVIVHHRESGLAVGCRSERSQHKNRDIALAHLNAMLSPPAAVPVEALKALVAGWRIDGVASDKYADELTQLIKERSNG